MLLTAQRELSARHFEQRTFDFVRGRRLAFFGLFGSRVNAKSFLAAGQIFLILNEGISYADRRQSGAYLVFRNLLLECEHARITAKKILSKHRLAAMKTEADADKNQAPGDGKGRLGELHEIELRRANEMKHRNGFQPVAIEQEIENHSRNDKRSE